MVVGAPDVDRDFEPALRLVPMVGDIGEEVGTAAVALDQDAVFVVAECRGAQPLGSLTLIDQAPSLQLGQRRLDLAGFVHRALRAELVELHAECAHVLPLFILHALEGIAPNQLAFRRTPLPIQPIAMFGPELAGQLGHVDAVIAAFRNRFLVSLQLPVAGMYGVDELVDLGAGVVDVELALHLVPGELEQPSDGVADGGATSVPHMQRARGVRRHELHVEEMADTPGAASVVLVGTADLAQLIPKVVAADAEVQETGPRDLGVLDVKGRQVECAQQLLSKLARHAAQAASNEHR